MCAYVVILLSGHRYQYDIMLSLNCFIVGDHEELLVVYMYMYVYPCQDHGFMYNVELHVCIIWLHPVTCIHVCKYCVLINTHKDIQKSH